MASDIRCSKVSSFVGSTWLGDVDGNLVVDVSDILHIVGNWGLCQ